MKLGRVSTRRAVAKFLRFGVPNSVFPNRNRALSAKKTRQITQNIIDSVGIFSQRENVRSDQPDLKQRWSLLALDADGG